MSMEPVASSGGVMRDEVDEIAETERTEGIGEEEDVEEDEVVLSSETGEEDVAEVEVGSLGEPNNLVRL